jgi:hypothetical protein
VVRLTFRAGLHCARALRAVMSLCRPLIVRLAICGVFLCCFPFPLSAVVFPLQDSDADLDRSGRRGDVARTARGQTRRHHRSRTGKAIRRARIPVSRTAQIAD